MERGQGDFLAKIAQLDQEETVEREQELKTKLWDVRIEDMQDTGESAGPGVNASWAPLEASSAAVPGSEGMPQYDEDSHASSFDELSTSSGGEGAGSHPSVTASGAVEMPPDSGGVLSSPLIKDLPKSMSTGPSLHQSGNESASETEDDSLVLKDVYADLASSSFQVAVRTSCEPAELMGTISQVAVALRTSEMERRHLSLECRAMRSEQRRLNAQVQELAKRDRELEEHIILLQAKMGEAGAPQLGTLSMLRAQMLDAARAEADRSQQEARAAVAARDSAVQELEAVKRQGTQTIEALRQEMGCLTQQLAQATVRSAAQERERREMSVRQEREADHMVVLSEQVVELRERLGDEQAGRREQEQGLLEARDRLAQEERANVALGERIITLEGELQGAQARLREAQAEVDVLKRATVGADEEELERRFTAELERVRREHEEQRAALHEEAEQLRLELASLRDRLSEGRHFDASGDNPMSQFIDDGSDVDDMVTREAGRGRRGASSNRQLGMGQGMDGEEGLWTEAEVARRVEMERAKIADAFQEELRSVLAGARRAFEQERAAEMAEVEREWEGERVRRERARLLEVEALRGRLEDEKDVALQEQRARLLAEEEEHWQAVRKEKERLEEQVGTALEVMQKVGEQPLSCCNKILETERQVMGGEGLFLLHGLGRCFQELEVRWAKEMQAQRESLEQAYRKEAEKGQDFGSVAHVGVQAQHALSCKDGECQTDAQERTGGCEGKHESSEATGAAEGLKELLAAQKGLLREKEELVKRYEQEAAALAAQLSTAKALYESEGSRHEAELRATEAEAERQCTAVRAELESRLKVTAKECEALRERCAMLEGREAATQGVEDEVQAMRGRMVQEIEQARSREQVVARLEAQLESTKRAAKEALDKARLRWETETQERWRKEREGLLGNAEQEWRAKLADIHAKMKLLQAALLKVGRRAAGKDELIKQLRQEVEENRQAEVRRREAETERVEAMVREGHEKDKRIKELDRALQRVRKEVQAQGTEVEGVMRGELQALEQRLGQRHEREMAEVLERARQETEKEIEVVISTLQRRYSRKLAKLEARFAKEKDEVIVTALLEARRMSHQGGMKPSHDKVRLTSSPTSRLGRRTKFYDY